MAKKLKTPGVYIEEINAFPGSVVEVETAIPAFIGYTEKATKKITNDLNEKPTRISSLLEYETYFGEARKEKSIAVSVDNNVVSVTPPMSADKSPFLMQYSMQMYFANGGGPCYIVSVGQYDDALPNKATVVEFANLNSGLDKILKEDEPTLIVFTDATSLASDAEFYNLYNNALKQCNKLQDRFTIIDTYSDVEYEDDNNDTVEPDNAIRNSISLEKDYLKYGAVYFPFLETILDYAYSENEIDVTISGNAAVKLDTLEATDNDIYNIIKTEIGLLPVKLPPSATMAGVYARVDKDRGIWKAPANVGLNFVLKPSIPISHEEQESLNVHSTGKSINAIRAFTGKGIMVWGARTLAGNDNEWKYVPVRRFFNMVEESVKKATEQFVFEPNDANTWIKVRAMIENFITLQWRAGALAGAKSEQAFYVKVGLGETMTAVDILEGRMNVEIGMAVVRPAEFIILKFSHKMQEA